MAETAIGYVHQTPEGGWRIAGSRVSLDSVVHAHREGLSPEAIADAFPSLSLEQVYGAIAFYLRHRAEIDPYLADQNVRWEELRHESEAAHGPLLERVRAHRGGSRGEPGP